MNASDRRSLSRILELGDAIHGQRPPGGSLAICRRAASMVTSVEGPPQVVAERILQQCQRMRSGSMGQMRKAMRLLMAAWSVAEGPRLELGAEVEVGRERLREAGLVDAGMFEVVAVLWLCHGGGDRPISIGLAERFVELQEAIPERLGWRSWAVEFPLCAELALAEASPGEQVDRCERIYRRLDELGVEPCDWIYLAALMLSFHPAPIAELGQRLVELRRRLRELGLAGREIDQDGVALLCFVERPAALLAGEVESRYRQLRDARPRASSIDSFALAASSTASDLAEGERTEQLRRLQALAAVCTTLDRTETSIRVAGYTVLGTILGLFRGR